MRRVPAVAGQFYERDRERLRKQVASLVEADAPREAVKGLLAPHAGLMYSGAVAGSVYSRIKFPRSFVLLGPNHTGMGLPVAMMDEGEWEVPTGLLAVNTALARSISREVPLVRPDSEAHAFEHSLEVQLPFVAHFAPEASIVPIAIMVAGLAELLQMGEGIARAIAGAGYPVTVAASSDMSHFLPEDVARARDRLAIERILELDAEGLYEVVRRENISMCGYMPTVVMLAASRALGATGAELVRYATSAEVTGDYRSVVGYAGVLVK
ncbi:MAG: AmmeMemoRadiSam system protein B [Nitrospirota bacterium]|jgi:AmmeMemoRadiSam system protein B